MRARDENTYLRAAGLSSAKAVLVETAVAIDVRQKILGAVRRAAHVVGHDVIEWTSAIDMWL